LGIQEDSMMPKSRLNPAVCRILALPLAFTALQAGPPAPAVQESFFARDSKLIIEDCTVQAHRIKFRDSRLLAEYGRSYLAIGKRRIAEEMFEQAVANDSRDPGTRFLIGWAWLKNGFQKEAVAAFDEMVKVGPKAKNWMTKAAACLLGAGMEPEAVKFMEMAYQRDRKDWQNCVHFGRAALGAQKKDLAARWFLRALNADPADECVWNDIALSYTDGGGTKVQ
jgi:tetratricopeptide (TPR) repeat protein